MRGMESNKATTQYKGGGNDLCITISDILTSLIKR